MNFPYFFNYSQIFLIQFIFLVYFKASPPPTAEPLSLQDLSRHAVRRTIGKGRQHRIQEMRLLPRKIRNYLEYQDRQTWQDDQTNHNYLPSYQT